jgi:hypothetical protein
MRIFTLLLVSLFFLAACTVPQDPIPVTLEQPGLNSPAPASSTPAENTATPPDAAASESSVQPPVEFSSLETPLADPATSALVDQAKQMLADKLGIDPVAIALFNLQARDWPDEALGCPLGGRNYAQVITPGYLIELEADGNIYAFHTDRTTRAVLCGIAPTREIYQPP